MADKTKISKQVKHIPKDAQVIMSVMKDMGISDYEPKVINQLLEFIYRYVTCILDDSKLYANHSKKKVIDLDDVRLAVKMQLEKSFTNPPPREVLLDFAKLKNSVPLPYVKPSYGLRLPSDRYCLNGANYKLKSGRTKKSFGGKSGFGGINRVNPQGYSVVKRPGALGAIQKTQTISMAKPAMKTQFTNVNQGKTQKQTALKLPAISDPSQVSLPTTKVEQEDSMKRKREEDNKYNLL